MESPFPNGWTQQKTCPENVSHDPIMPPSTLRRHCQCHFRGELGLSIGYQCQVGPVGSSTSFDSEASKNPLEVLHDLSCEATGVSIVPQICCQVSVWRQPGLNQFEMLKSKCCGGP